MQKQRQQLLLITSYNIAYQEESEFAIHSLWHAVEVLPPALVRDVIMQVGHWCICAYSIFTNRVRVLKNTPGWLQARVARGHTPSVKGARGSL